MRCLRRMCTVPTGRPGLSAIGQFGPPSCFLTCPSYICERVRENRTTAPAVSYLAREMGSMDTVPGSRLRSRLRSRLHVLRIHRRTPPGGRLLTTALAVWTLAVSAGFCVLWTYEHTPGTDDAWAHIWPDETLLKRASDQFTLLMFLHPHCPCSRASIAELERAISRCAGRFSAVLVFVKPEQFGSGWEKTDLWHTSQRLPDVRVACDVNGIEAQRFGARTSGFALLYDRDGRLRFSGGLTSSRGHHGDSIGRHAVESIVTTGASPTRSSPVFGCPLSASTLPEQQSSSACCVQ